VLKSVFAFLSLCLIAPISADASDPSSKEFRSAEGVVRIASVPEAVSSGGGTAGNGLQSIAMDTLSDIAALQTLEDRGDALLELYFMDMRTGAELRFPAKLSHLVAFLQQHGEEFQVGTSDERAVAVIRSFSQDLRVHMLTPDEGGTK
jgi:hypothetical protein